MEEIFENINKVREAWSFEEHKKQTFAWEKNARELIAVQGVAKTDAIKMLLGEIESELKLAIDKLVWSKGLSEIERARLEVKRDDYLWFYSFFAETDKKLKSLEEKVLSEIKNL
jgi:hypothetical protein